MAETDESGRVAWFFIGALAGAAVALLYAPSSGRVARRIIKRRAGAGGDALRESGRELVDRGKELYGRGRELAEEAADLFDRGRRLARG